MKLVISTLHFQWTTITDCIDTARDQLGLDGIEMSWHPSFAHPFCTREDLDVLGNRTSDGLVLSAHIWDDLLHMDVATAADCLQGWLRVCRLTGTREIIMHGGAYDDQQAGLRRLRSVLDRVVADYERAGVTINLENHYAYDYRDCRELLSAPWEFRQILLLESPALKFCFDTGHGHMTGNSAVLIQELAPWLNYVHLADNQGTHDDHDMYGEGTVPWDSLLEELHNVNFDKSFCIEFPVFDEKAPFHQCVCDLRRRFGA